MLDIKDIATDHLESDIPSLSEFASLAKDKIDLLVFQEPDIRIRDGSVPTPPPFLILDAMVEPYFNSINPHFPIWTAQSFKRMATALRHSVADEQDLASIVSCNNMILMCLTASSASSRRGLGVRERNKTSSIDSDLITGFLRNAERAFDNIGQFLSSRLINVQALLSLVRVLLNFESNCPLKAVN